MRALAFCLSAAILSCARGNGDPLLAAASNADAGAGSFVGPDASTPPAGNVAAPGVVYAHTDDTLYRVDTATHVVTKAGAFSGCAHVSDIALDGTSTLYATNGTSLYLVENNTGRCTHLADGTFPNSLSFVPGLAATEALVGYVGGDYVHIDTKTGVTTKVGSLGAGLESSGDIVSAGDGTTSRTYLTVKGDGCNDCLVEIDPKTGSLVKNFGSLGYRDAFGLAFWGGDVFAFTANGDVLLVTFDGDELRVDSVDVADSLPFRGAGSTTSAPLGPVN